MRVRIRYEPDGVFDRKPRHVLLIADSEDEMQALDLLGNVAKEERIEVKGTMQLSDGYGEMYLSFPVGESCGEKR